MEDSADFFGAPILHLEVHEGFTSGGQLPKVHEIFQLTTSHDRIVTFEPIFPETQYGNLHTNYSIITEDSEATKGFTFFA